MRIFFSSDMPRVLVKAKLMEPFDSPAAQPAPAAQICQLPLVHFPTSGPQHPLVIRALYAEDALAPEQIGPSLLQQRGQPLIELAHICAAVCHNAHTRDAGVVLVIQVGMVFPLMAVAAVMVMVVVVGRMAAVLLMVVMVVVVLMVVMVVMLMVVGVIFLQAKAATHMGRWICQHTGYYSNTRAWYRESDSLLPVLHSA
jgi:hypothetical protein